MDLMKKFFVQSTKTLANAVLAGLVIGIAGTVFLAVKNIHLGAFLFAFALMTILCYNFRLFSHRGLVYNISCERRRRNAFRN